jgi:hypothetical protein
MKSNSEKTITDYAEALPDSHAAICRRLHKEIDAALPKAFSSKIWHSVPVWFKGENPVVGYKATPKHVSLLFWSGQLFGDSSLKSVGKFKAAQIQFTDASEIDPKSLRRWLKKSSAEIWDYHGHFKTQKALQKRGKP